MYKTLTALELPSLGKQKRLLHKAFTYAAGVFYLAGSAFMHPLWNIKHPLRTGRSIRRDDIQPFPTARRR